MIDSKISQKEFAVNLFNELNRLSAPAHLPIQIPAELNPYRDSPLYALFEVGYKKGSPHSKQPLSCWRVGIPEIKSRQAHNKPETLVSYYRAMDILRDNPDWVLALSITEASKLLGKQLVIVDLDLYHTAMDWPFIEQILATNTYIDISPSGKGLHCWSMTNRKPELVPKDKKPIKRKGIDHPKGFITITGNVYKNQDIVQHIFTEKELNEEFEIRQKHLAESPIMELYGDDGRMSTVVAYNRLNPDISILLLRAGYTTRDGQSYCPPTSVSGGFGTVVLPSSKGDWNVVYTHNETGVEDISHRIVDPWEINWRYVRADIKTHAQAVAMISKELNILKLKETEGFDETVDDFNTRITERELENDTEWLTLEEARIELRRQIDEGVRWLLPDLFKD